MNVLNLGLNLEDNQLVLFATELNTAVDKPQDDSSQLQKKDDNLVIENMDHRPMVCGPCQTYTSM